MNDEEMSPEELNVAIAEACGWKRRADLDYLANRPEGQQWVNIWANEGRCLYRQQLPNYHSSLDAMATAEATLTDNEYNRYCAYLSRICADDYYELRKEEHFSADPISAKANQRARAFLRVKGKLP